MPVIYAWWLKDKKQGEKPVALFEAACNHVGYVSANLAVRWHPQGTHIIYVKQVDNDRHGIFEFDLPSKQSMQVGAIGSQALIFDWSPDGSHLVCVLGGTAKSQTDGIWIGRSDQKT